MKYSELKEKKVVSFYESASELNLLTTDNLLGIQGALNAAMESIETVVDIL